MVQTAPNDELTKTATALLRELTHLIPITASTPEEAISCVNHARPGAPIALILPLTAVSGPTAQENARQSWTAFRRAVMQECHKTKIITSATYDVEEGELSSHALLAAIKELEPKHPDYRQKMLFVNLPEEMASPEEAHALALHIRKTASELQPGTVRWDRCGDLPPAHASLVRWEPDQPWQHARTLDPSVLTFAEALQEGKLNRLRFNTVPLAELAGITNAVITDETDLTLINNRLRWTSTAPAARAATLGEKPAKAFTAAFPKNEDHIEAITAWLNSSMGLISLWHAATHYHNGRSYLTIEQLRALRVPDMNALKPENVQRMAEIHRALDHNLLLPPAHAWQDQRRRQLDRQLLHALGAADTKTLAALDQAKVLWCLEPSVQGGQGISPKNADNMTHLRHLAQNPSAPSRRGISDVITSAATKSANTLLKNPGRQSRALAR